ncbi:MAG: hypothetical protein OXC44_04610 [Proteobacteria bacterium]|nr:hypothetical protein [Pseudomonadota bacterium]
MSYVESKRKKTIGSCFFKKSMLIITLVSFGFSNSLQAATLHCAHTEQNFQRTQSEVAFAPCHHNDQESESTENQDFSASPCALGHCTHCSVVNFYEYPRLLSTTFFLSLYFYDTQPRIIVLAEPFFRPPISIS